jgi:hypothetical protein
MPGSVFSIVGSVRAGKFFQQRRKVRGEECQRASAAATLTAPATVDAMQDRRGKGSSRVSRPLRAIGHFSDGSTEDLSMVASWKSSDEDIASGRKLGPTTVTATYLGISGSTVVNVVESFSTRSRSRRLPQGSVRK